MQSSTYKVNIPTQVIQALGFTDANVAQEIKKELAVNFFQRKLCLLARLANSLNCLYGILWNYYGKEKFQSIIQKPNTKPIPKPSRTFFKCL